uniref:Small integral membrane protein 5 n=4 Tax=Sus scrofa TaxID=9823 RepID=A0A8D1TRJ4_PIG
MQKSNRRQRPSDSSASQKQEAGGQARMSPTLSWGDSDQTGAVTWWRRGRRRCQKGPKWPQEEPGRDPHGMTAADFVQEMHSVWERLLLKLQRLPQAEPVEIATFSVLVIFAATVVLLLLVAICYCCVQCCCPDRRGRKVQVRPMTPLQGTRR